MISNSEAQERLNLFFNPDHSNDQLRRLEQLPSHLSTLGQFLIKAGPAWETIQKEFLSEKKLHFDPIRGLTKLSVQQRKSLFEALFPGVALYVEHTWKLFDLFPYQSDYQRRPFRVSHTATSDARAHWLQRLSRAMRGYEHQDIVWLAAWAPRMGHWIPDAVGYLFSAAIDKGDKVGNEVLSILEDSANGVHEIGLMGRHVVRGLLCSSNKKAWECIERLLLAAQREEGLRQVILEVIDEAHPLAFRRILRLVIDHKLFRFSATIRALSVWFGLPFEAASQKAASRVLERVLHFLSSKDECNKVIKHGSAEDAYYALWALAFDDALDALSYAVDLYQSSSVEKRFAAAYLLGQLGLRESIPELLKVLGDEDLRISAIGFQALTSRNIDSDLIDSSDMFEHLERLLPRVKNKKNTLKPLIWDWLPVSLDREQIAAELINCLGDRSPKRLLPYLSIMDSGDRGRLARVLTASKQKDQENLQTLLFLVGDLSSNVREIALQGLRDFKLTDMDVIKLEELLSRRSQDLRRGIIQLLLGLPDNLLIESARRLMVHKGKNQRLVALEILEKCKQNQRFPDHVQLLALEYSQNSQLSASETQILNRIQLDAERTYTLDDALGLLNPDNLTRPIPVKPGKSSEIKLSSQAAINLIKSLDELVELHRNDEIMYKRGNVKKVELLGNLHWGWGFRAFNRSRIPDADQFPLKDIFELWWQARSNDLRDTDGHEFLRAYVIINMFLPSFGHYSTQNKDFITDLQEHFDIQINFKLNYRGIIQSLLEWAIVMHPMEGEVDFVLDALDESIARIPQSELTGVKEMHGEKSVRIINRNKLAYLELARWLRTIRPEAWTNRHHAQIWNAVSWLNEPEPGLPGRYEVLEDALLAYQSGAATRDDLLYMFLGPRKEDSYSRYFGLLSQFSVRKLHANFEPLLRQFPVISEIVDACRERILEIECSRGELPTVATAPANSIRSVPGIRNLFRMLSALGAEGFERGYITGQSRSGVFSHLIRNSYPIETDTKEEFALQAHIHNIPESRLIELAIYAPQWADFVQHATGWDHLSDAIWWLYAHTKDRQWGMEIGTREQWATRIGEYTPLSANDLMDGAVDVVWFQQMYSQIGKERWERLYDAALYTSGGIGHGRARLFSDAMLGKVTVEKVIERIFKKRNQDSVRALGLIPLDLKKDRSTQVLIRYEAMQEFLRTGKKFGSQRRASEKLAVSVGMQNLARTAGYTDPQRLEWAMEVEAISDLSAGAIRVQSGDYQVALTINEIGEPNLVFHKNDKLIKTLPPAIKKVECISEILQRKQQLERQVSRMRLSLEQAMSRGDMFSVTELKTLFRHPILKVMIEQLVFVSTNFMGYPFNSGSELIDYAGEKYSLSDVEHVRIAHPLDLLIGKHWHHWQHDCFITERIQPFKQIFRELYVLTSAEKQDGDVSRRYEGQQINPRQAAALFSSRGWVIDSSFGVQKTFHQEGISARVGFLYGAFTPIEVEGSTLEGISFTRRGQWRNLNLDEIPPRIFSEVMRDLDLVVSVAHAGGVDPETSSSSIEARAALIRETTSLLNMNNIKVSERHVVIDGKLANYNVNLGSGIVHKQPGGALCIIPVHSQHRGRIFLPFADNDPKTAEIVSKVIMLAKDDQIKDPTILEQIL